MIAIFYVDFLASFAGKLMLFNGLTCEFRPIRLRKKNAKCEVCAGSSISSVVDYEEFCCSKACDKVQSFSFFRDFYYFFEFFSR